MSVHAIDEENVIHRMDPESAHNQVRLVCGTPIAAKVDGSFRIAAYGNRWQDVTCVMCLAHKPIIGDEAIVGARVHYLGPLAACGPCHKKPINHASRDWADVTCPKCIAIWIRAQQEDRP
jgi:hypothetical protein